MLTIISFYLCCANTFFMFCTFSIVHINGLNAIHMKVFCVRGYYCICILFHLVVGSFEFSLGAKFNSRFWSVTHDNLRKAPTREYQPAYLKCSPNFKTSKIPWKYISFSPELKTKCILQTLFPLKKCSLPSCKKSELEKRKTLRTYCLFSLPFLRVQTKQRKEFLSFWCSWISPDGILLVQSPIGILNILALCGKSPGGYFVSRLHTKCISSQSSKPAFNVANFLCLMVFILKGHFPATICQKQAHLENILNKWFKW